MTEHEMEELIALFPDEFFPGRGFVLKGRQKSFAGVGIFDLLFQDQHGTNILLELKARPAKAEDIDQLVKHRDALKDRGERRVLMCLVAPRIPPTIRELLEDFGIDHAEIHQAQLRLVAETHDINLNIQETRESVEKGQSVGTPQAPWQKATGTTKVEKGWYYWVDQGGKGYFLALVNQKGSCSVRFFDAQSGAFCGKPKNQPGDFQEAFREYLRSGTSVVVSRQPSLEKECKVRLPDPVLAELRRQIPCASSGSSSESETADAKAKKEKLVPSGFVPTPPPDAGKEKANRWSFGQAAQSTGDEADFLSRCDEPARAFFSRLFEKQRAIANKTRITWKHESGFSMQFYFPRLGFVEMVWGFPQVNREGKPSRNGQSLVFPFDFAARRDVPGEYINAFGEALDAICPLSGGKRPSMRVVTLEATEADRVLEAIFDYALRASTAKA